MSIDSNAYLDLFANQSPEDLARVARRSDFTASILGGRDLLVPPRVMEELTQRGIRSADQVIADLELYARSVRVGPEGRANVASQIKSVIRRPGDERVGASMFEAGGEIALGDKRLARALVRKLQVPREMIKSLRPESWTAWELAVIAGIIGYQGATAEPEAPATLDGGGA